MRIAIDTHTHTVASGHAYSTVYELALGARKRRLEGFVLTDHGPALPGGPIPTISATCASCPSAFAACASTAASRPTYSTSRAASTWTTTTSSQLHFAYAGLHELCFPPRSEADNTAALVAALAQSPGRRRLPSRQLPSTR